MSERWRYSYHILLAAFLATLAVRLTVALNVNLFQDEALYAYVASRDPFSFCPHPPGTGLMVRLGIAMFGHWELGVRFVSIVLSSLTLVSIFLVARLLLGMRGAAGAVILAAAAPIYLIFGAICTPDSAQLFFWTLLTWATAKALGLEAPGSGSLHGALARGASLRWWLLAGVCLGVGLYFKYILILYVPSLLLCLLLHPPWREKLRTPGPWLALAVAFLLFVPVAAYWDYAHGWKTLRYHLVERQSYELSARYLGVYLGGHFLFYSPLIYLAALAGMVHAGWRGIRERDGRLIYLFSMAVVVWAFFAIVALLTRRGLSREQWDAMAYVPAMIAATALYHDKLREWAGTRKAARLRVAAQVSVSLGFAMSAVIVLEGLTGFASTMVGTRTPFTALYGWKQMAGEADRQMASLPEAENAFFLGDSFVPTLQYAFYGTRKVHLYAMPHRRNARYGLDSRLVEWGMAAEFLGNETGRNALYVEEARRLSNDARSSETELEISDLSAMFRQVKAIDPIEVRHGARVVRRFRMVHCLGLRPLAEWKQYVLEER
jgi:hypothetical protein